MQYPLSLKCACWMEVSKLWSHCCLRDIIQIWVKICNLPCSEIPKYSLVGRPGENESQTLHLSSTKVWITPFWENYVLVFAPVTFKQREWPERPWIYFTRSDGAIWKSRALCSSNSCFQSDKGRYLRQNSLSFVRVPQLLCRKEREIAISLVVSCMDPGWPDSRRTPSLRVLSWS